MRIFRDSKKTGLFALRATGIGRFTHYRYCHIGRFTRYRSWMFYTLPVLNVLHVTGIGRFTRYRFRSCVTLTLSEPGCDVTMTYVGAIRTDPFPAVGPLSARAMFGKRKRMLWHQGNCREIIGHGTAGLALPGKLDSHL